MKYDKHIKTEFILEADRYR